MQSQTTKLFVNVSDLMARQGHVFKGEGYLVSGEGTGRLTHGTCTHPHTHTHTEKHTPEGSTKFRGASTRFPRVPQVARGLSGRVKRGEDC